MDFYGSVDGFFLYCERMGYNIGDLEPSPSDSVEAILLRGSTYIDGKYRPQFNGKRTDGRAQDREWPRTDATDADGTAIPSDEVPVEIERATYEAALREHDNPGSLVPDYLATERVKSETVGPLSVTYADATERSAADAWPVIGVIDMILAPLLGETQEAFYFGEVTR